MKATPLFQIAKGLGIKSNINDYQKLKFKMQLISIRIDNI